MHIYLIEREAINLNAKLIQKKIEEMHYWDARVLKMDTSYFGDETIIMFEDTDYNVKLLFTGCSQFSFITSVEDRIKPLKELTKLRIPYFIQNIELGEVEINKEESLLKCHILMPPLSVEIVCTNVLIDKV